MELARDRVQWHTSSVPAVPATQGTSVSRQNISLCYVAQPQALLDAV
jgi:hypothetical protein